MPDRSPYSVKTLLLYLADLERREQTARDLPDGGGDLNEDPGFSMLANIVISRQKFEDWPDVRRFKRDCVEAGYTFDSEGTSQWIARVCQDLALDLREVGEMSLDDFCELYEQRRKQPAVKESTNEARDTWMYEEKKAGKTHSEIRRALEKQHPEWEQLDSEQAVGRAIDRYCDRKQLPKLRRKSG